MWPRALPGGTGRCRRSGAGPRYTFRKLDREALIAAAPLFVPRPRCPRKRQITGRLPDRRADRVGMRRLSASFLGPRSGTGFAPRLAMAGEDLKSDPRSRVAILDDHERSRASLRAAIWSAGGAVVGEAVRCVD